MPLTQTQVDAMRATANTKAEELWDMITFAGYVATTACNAGEHDLSGQVRIIQGRLMEVYGLCRLITMPDGQPAVTEAGGK